MSKDRNEADELAKRLYREHKTVLDFFAKPSSSTGFEVAVRHLFGDAPARGKLVRIGNTNLVLSAVAKDHVSFLHAGWVKELEKAKSTWKGCENWWAGYPLIAWVELRNGDDGISGSLKLNAEVGPVADRTVRQGIVEAVRVAAVTKDLKRIKFPDMPKEERRLYSRFLHQNALPVSDVRDPKAIEETLVRIISDFVPEFDLVTAVISQLHLPRDHSRQR